MASHRAWLTSLASLALPRLRSAFIRTLLLPAVVFLGLLQVPVPAAAPSLTLAGGVQPSVASDGTQLTITGVGFGAKKPKVQLVSSFSKKSPSLKVLAFSDTLLVVQVAAAQPGTWDVVVKPKVKGAAPIVFANAAEVRLPMLQGLSPALASPGDTVALSGQFFGTRKGSVKLGGKGAKVLLWAAESISVRVPSKLKPGAYEVLVKNRIGTGSMPCAFTVPGAGGLATGCSDRVTAILGTTPFESTGFLSVFALGSTGPPPLLTVVAVRPGTPRVQIQLTIPFDVALPVPGPVTGAPEGFVRVEQGGGLFDPDTTVWTTQGQGDDYAVAITSVAGGQLVGTLQAMLVRVQGTAGDSALFIPSGSFRVRAGP